MAANNEKGQSILEVVFVLPFLFLFVGLLFKLNLSIQSAINNQQFAHSQTYILTANSAEYPRLGFRLSPSLFKAAGQDQMILGVADPSGITQANNNDSDIEPIPQTQKIGRNKTIKGSDDRGDQAKRSEIRIRNTAALCTQSNNVPTGTSERWPFNREVCQYSGISKAGEAKQ